MNSIRINNISKKYQRHWLFKNVDTELFTGNSLLISGHNGSGKSTLLKIISGFVTPTSGLVNFTVNKVEINQDAGYNHIAFAAHYIDLIDDFTLLENILFYNKFKKFSDGLNAKQIIKLAYLEEAENKILKYFSSGMKQRIKLVLAIMSDVPFLFLDEPVSNLDATGIAWYHNLIKQQLEKKVVVICSNNTTTEAAFCNKQINIEDFKR